MNIFGAGLLIFAASGSRIAAIDSNDEDLLHLTAPSTPWNVDGSLFPHRIPSIRFTPWKILTHDLRSVAKNVLNYHENTWNLPGSNPIEELSWSSLTEKQKVGAKKLGFHESTWDCWQNHYNDYTWEEMVEEGIEEHWEDLGYGATTWDGDIFVPIEDDYWSEMDDDNDEDEDKTALRALCYFEETWDGVLPIFVNRMNSNLLEVDAGSCDNEEYDMYFSFLDAHLYNIMSPASSNTNPTCQDSIVLHDHAGTKAAFNATDVPPAVWATDTLLHIGTRTWSAILSSFANVGGFGTWGQYDFVNNNCALLTLTFYNNLGISVENNATVISYATNHLVSLPAARAFAEQNGLIPTQTPDILFKEGVRRKVTEFISNYYASQS